MSQNKLIELVTAKYSSKAPPEFRIGDTVNVHIKIVEGGKHRVQVFNGVVIACRGRGTGETFTVRRIVGKEGVERIFLVHSPNISKVEVIRSGKVRRAKLYFLRDRVGKSRRLREKRVRHVRGSAAGKSSKEKGDGQTETGSEQRELAGVQG